MVPEIVDLSFDIAASPDAVRNWWWQFSDDYRATDPREQPHRIRTLERTPDRLRVATYWRGPFGKEMEVEETLSLRPDGSWTADLRMMGFRIHDQFKVSSTKEGCRLTIHSELTPENAASRILRPLLAMPIKRGMRKTWSDAAAICAKEA